MRHTTLSDGQSFYYHSKANRDILLREMFRERQYLRHGITFPEDGCYFDVGANIGSFVRLLGGSLSRATVYAFEPVPQTFELLRANTRSCGHLRLHLLNCGLAGSPGTATFAHFPRISVMSSMVPDRSASFRRDSRQFIVQEMRMRGGVLRWLVDHTPVLFWRGVAEVIRRHYHQSTPVECRLRTLSEVLDQFEVQEIDLLKIDVEGAELEVLRGIRAEHWSRIRQMAVEVHQGAESAAEIQARLKQHGFDVVAEPCGEHNQSLWMLYARRSLAAVRPAKSA